MKEREELELVLKLIGKFNLPLSPILEHAIREKIDMYSETRDGNQYDDIEDPLEPKSDGKFDDASQISAQRQYDIIDKTIILASDCKIENKTNQSFIISVH